MNLIKFHLLSGIVEARDAAVAVQPITQNMFDQNQQYADCTGISRVICGCLGIYHMRFTCQFYFTPA